MQTRFLAFLSIFVMLSATLIILIATQSVVPISPITPMVPISQIGASDTSGWQTYTNPEFGFSLNYPPTWKVTGDSGSDIYLSLLNQNDEKLPSIYLSDMDSLPPVFTTATTVGDLDAFYTTAAPTNPGGTLVYIFPKPNGRYLAVGFSPFNATTPTQIQKDNIGIFTQILYSLRLTTVAIPPVIPIGQPTPKSGCYYLQVECVKAPCPPILTCPNFYELPTPPYKDAYTCPESDWVDCMPSPDGNKLRCQKDYLNWMQENCPNFQGAAY